MASSGKRIRDQRVEINKEVAVEIMRKFVFIVLAVALVVVVLAAFQPNPGVTMQFVVYEDGVRRDLFARADVVAVVLIRAVTPDGEVVDRFSQYAPVVRLLK